MPKQLYLVETVTLVKRQYLVTAEDMIGAQDDITMEIVRPYDKVSLGETIVGTMPIFSDENGNMIIPEIDPIKRSKIERAELDKLES